MPVLSRVFRFVRIWWRSSGGRVVIGAAILGDSQLGNIRRGNDLDCCDGGGGGDYGGEVVLGFD